MRAADYEPENYKCGNCIYYGNDCKRTVDGLLEFAKPYFACVPNCNVVCSDFELKPYMKYAKENWIDFETYFIEFVENWLPYSNTDILIYFCLHGDKSVRYGVKLLDYVYGKMWLDDKTLNAVEKMYYKQCRSGFGYKLIREEINGVDVNNDKLQIFHPDLLSSKSDPKGSERFHCRIAHLRHKSNKQKVNHIDLIEQANLFIIDDYAPEYDDTGAIFKGKVVKDKNGNYSWWKDLEV